MIEMVSSSGINGLSASLAASRRATWLTCKEAEILNGDWINPDAGKVLLSDYGTVWIEERANLRPKTIGLYRYLLRCHIQPHFVSHSETRVRNRLCESMIIP